MNRVGESPVYSYLKNPSMVDFAGHLSVVAFVSGCNFSCGFCHNARLMSDKHAGISWQDLEKACCAFQGNWVNAAVISGGEPTLQENLSELIELFRGFGWDVKLDTNGSFPDRLLDCLSRVTYVAMDVKAGRSGYDGLTGFADGDAIAASVKLIRERAVDYEFRTTVIEPVHTDAQMTEIGEMIQGAKRYVLQPFVPRDDLPGEMFRTLKRTSPDRLEHLRDLMSVYADDVTIRGEA